MSIITSDSPVVGHIVATRTLRQCRNHLLAMLPADEFERVSAKLTREALRQGQVFYSQGDHLSKVYFLEDSLCSVTMAMDDGQTIEVAIAGSEGLVGIAAVLGDGLATGRALVHHAGQGAYVMPIDAFHREMERRGAFHEVVSRYVHAFVQMLLQSVACNGLHSAKERCCRRLLMVHDRLERDQFPLTHESLSSALGVRRPTVTLVINELVNEGVVEARRGQITVRDRARLEASACECYRRTSYVMSTFRRPTVTVAS